MPQQRRGNELSAGRFILAVLVCGVLGASVVGYLMAGGSRPSPTDDAAAAIAAATAPRGTDTPAPKIDDGTWGEDDLRSCKAEATAAADAAAARHMRAVSDNRVGLGGPSADMIERSAYLLCTAIHKPSHLCQSYWQGQFIEAIKGYVAAFNDVSKQAYWTSHNVEERARRAVGHTQAELRSANDDLRQTTRDLAQMHDKITAAFRALIADGIINPDTFGVFFGLGIPPDIAALIGEAHRERSLCG